MRARCGDAKNQDYARYGGRGISVCARWRDSFANFLADMGQPPFRGALLDRIDNDGHYEPGNCRWATLIEQARNRSNVRLVTFRGETLCVAEWAERIGISQFAIYSRLNNGWSIERALSRGKARVQV